MVSFCVMMLGKCTPRVKETASSCLSHYLQYPRSPGIFLSTSSHCSRIPILRADDQLAETRKQLTIARGAFDEELRRLAMQPRNLNVNVSVSSATQTSPNEHQTLAARTDETQTNFEGRIETACADENDRAIKTSRFGTLTSTNQLSSLRVVGHSSNHTEAIIADDCDGRETGADIIGRRVSAWEDERSRYVQDVADEREVSQNARIRGCDMPTVSVARSIEASEEVRDGVRGVDGIECLDVERSLPESFKEVSSKLCLTEVDAKISKETPIHRVRPTDATTAPDNQRRNNEAILVEFGRSSQVIYSHPSDNQGISGAPGADKGTNVVNMREDAGYTISVHQREACDVHMVRGREDAQTKGQHESEGANKAITTFGAKTLDVEQVSHTQTEASLARESVESKRLVQTTSGREKYRCNEPGASNTSDIHPVFSGEIGCIEKFASSECYTASGIASEELVAVVENGDDGSEYVLSVFRDYDVPDRQSKVDNSQTRKKSFCDGGKVGERNFKNVNARTTVEFPTAPNEDLDAIRGMISVDVNCVPAATMETTISAEDLPAVDVPDSAAIATKGIHAIPDLHPDVSCCMKEQDDNSSLDRLQQGAERTQRGGFLERVSSFGSSRRVRNTGIPLAKDTEATVAWRSLANDVRGENSVLGRKASMLSPFRASKPMEGKTSKPDRKKGGSSSNSKLSAPGVLKAAAKKASAIRGKIPQMQAPEAAQSVPKSSKTDIFQIGNNSDKSAGLTGRNGTKSSRRSGLLVQPQPCVDNDQDDRNCKSPSRSKSSSTRETEHPRNELQTGRTSRPETPSVKSSGFAGRTSIGEEALS